jgi:ABC-type iron transport system FetAB ATPase subunit
VQVFIDSPDSLLASFESRIESGRLILVSGPSGSGKLRWCPVLANSASILGILVSGLGSPAVLVNAPTLRSVLTCLISPLQLCGGWQVNSASIQTK